MSQAPEIQIINREQYFAQRIESVPNYETDPLSAPNSIRLRTRIIGLSASNLNVTKVAFLFGWWDAFPVPRSLALRFPGYGRTGSWGYAEVLDSTTPLVSVGSYVWGYLPLGTMYFDVAIQRGKAPNHVIVTDPHRQHMPFYNRHVVLPAAIKDQIEAHTEACGYDALFKIMFEASHLMARFVFSEDPIMPSLGAKISRSDTTDATVIIFAPGSKAALCLAWGLKNYGHSPKRIIGVASEMTKHFVQGTNLYDQVLSTTGSALDVLGQDREQRAVIVDYGGRGDVASSWTAELYPAFKNLLLLSIGSEISQTHSATISADIHRKPPDYLNRVVMSDMQAAAITKVGEKDYFQDLETCWQKFRVQDIPGFKIRWGFSMKDVSSAWQLLASNEARPSEGLAFSL